MIDVGGLIEPRALGVGCDLIDGFLNNRFLFSVVIIVLLVKAIIWLFALSSDISGGVLAPLLIFGSATGWTMGLYLPGGDAGFWALLGMEAMMGGTMRTPLTGTFFAVEVRGEFSTCRSGICCNRYDLCGQCVVDEEIISNGKNCPAWPQHHS